MKLEISVTGARMRAPVVSAHGEMTLRELVRVTVSDATGLSGHGEAAPLPSYDGVSMAETLAALEDCGAVLANADEATSREELLARCASAAVLPQALAAIDLALWDLEGRRADAPVWQLLDVPGSPAAVTVNATVAAADRASAASAAAEARAAGFPALKLKVGLGDDAGRLAAVRAAAGPDMAIRLDANGAWSPAEAIAMLRMLEPVGIELCEEPCHGLEAIRSVAAETPVAVALDESARLPNALDERLCEAVCLKISGCGGISGVLQDARRAQAAGYGVYLASTYDGPLGIAAALHVAAALRPAGILDPHRACGLATLSAFAARPDPLPAVEGRIRIPTGAGLGDGLLRFYRPGW